MNKASPTGGSPSPAAPRGSPQKGAREFGSGKHGRARDGRAFQIWRRLRLGLWPLASLAVHVLLLQHWVGQPRPTRRSLAAPPAPRQVAWLAAPRPRPQPSGPTPVPAAEKAAGALAARRLPAPIPPAPKPKERLPDRGQIVDIAPSQDEAPDRADFLAEHNSRAEHETRSRHASAAHANVMNSPTRRHAPVAPREGGRSSAQADGEAQAQAEAGSRPASQAEPTAGQTGEAGAAAAAAAAADGRAAAALPQAVAAAGGAAGPGAAEAEGEAPSGAGRAEATAVAASVPRRGVGGVQLAALMPSPGRAGPQGGEGSGRESHPSRASLGPPPGAVGAGAAAGDAAPVAGAAAPAAPIGLDRLIPQMGALSRLAGGPMNDALSKLDVGDGTFLNAREFKHASFFNRLKREVAQNWHPDRERGRRDPTGLIYGRGVRRTVLKVTLDPQGELVRSEVQTSSGLDFVDQEARAAFQRASPFRNPPKALVEDGESLSFLFGFEERLSY